MNWNNVYNVFMNYFLKISFLSAFFLGLFIGRAFCIDIFILSSKEIIPYNTCIEGLQESLTEYSLQLENLKGDLEKGRKILQNIRNKTPGLFIAVGPEAAFVLSKADYLSSRIFCMVRNPVKLLGKNGVYPGVSLNIPPPSFQIKKITEAFPERKKIGIFFGSKSNQIVIDTFYEEAKKQRVEVVKFPISSAKDISSVINSNQFSVDVLLIIPDEKLGKPGYTKILDYIIKECLRKKIPVVGYNSWFAKNGALLSFIIDYKNVGIQTAEMAKGLLQKNVLDELQIEPPKKIKISVDLKTAKKLGVIISPGIIQQASEVIR